jgi:hypothetical protein
MVHDWKRESIIMYAKWLFVKLNPTLVLHNVDYQEDFEMDRICIYWVYSFVSEKEEFLFRLKNKHEELQEELESHMIRLQEKLVSGGLFRV